jgi:hypothetical protein
LPTQHRSVSREIEAIRGSLQSITTSLARLGPILEQLADVPAEPATVAANGGRRPRPRLSPQRRAALKLQGQYMGYLRNLKPRQKSQVKALRQSKGISPAIALARRLGSR